MLKVLGSTGKKKPDAKKGQRFEISENLFEEIEAYIAAHKVAEGDCFPIIDGKGRLLFYVTYPEDLIAGIKRKDLTNYKNQMRNVKNLDFTFLDQYQKIVFLSVDNYSVAIARLLQKYRPRTKVVFCDKRVSYLIRGGVRILRLPFSAAAYMELTEKWMRGERCGFSDRLKAFAAWKLLERLKKAGNCCIITAGRRNHPGKDGVVFNSQNALYSLLWKKREDDFGKANVDKKIVILDYNCGDEGIGSIISCAFAHFMWMTQEGYVPVMNLSVYPNQYLNAAGENMWEYFFEPISDVTVEEAYKSKYVITASENDISWCDFHINPLQRKYMNILENAAKFRETVRINRETENYIESKMPAVLREGKRVLGVVARGTDFRNAAAVKTNKIWRQNVIEIKSFIQLCSSYKKEHHYDYIFVATEDQVFFELFQKQFGKEMLSVSQTRVTYDYDNQEFKPVSELLIYEDKRMLGNDYLTVIRSLTACSALIYNVECGAVRMACLWKEDAYEEVQCISADRQGGML